MKTVLECVTLTRDHVTINTEHFGIMCIPCNVATVVMSAYLEGVLKTLPHDTVLQETAAVQRQALAGHHL